MERKKAFGPNTINTHSITCFCESIQRFRPEIDSVKHSFTQSTANQFVIQPTRHSFSQSFIQSFIYYSVSQPVSQSVCMSIKQSVSQSISQTAIQKVVKSRIESPITGQKSVNQLLTQSIKSLKMHIRFRKLSSYHP